MRDEPFEKVRLTCPKSHTYRTERDLAEGDPCPKCGEPLVEVFEILDPPPGAGIEQEGR